MNHDRPLFGGGAIGNVRLKQAVNHAIDRIAMINARGAYAGVVNDQYLPPSMRGFRNAAIYPSRPNLARAQELAQGNLRGGRGVFYCADTDVAVCQVVQQNLQAIGLDMEIQLFPRAVQFTKAGTRGAEFDLLLNGWGEDYPDPYDFLQLLDGSTIRPEHNVNFSYFNSPAYNRKIAQASSLIGRARYRAFGNLDIDLARNAAPLATFMTDNTRHFVSASTGCYRYHPIYELDLAAICKSASSSPPPPACSEAVRVAPTTYNDLPHVQVTGQCDAFLPAGLDQVRVDAPAGKQIWAYSAHSTGCSPALPSDYLTCDVKPDGRICTILWVQPNAVAGEGIRVRLEKADGQALQEETLTLPATSEPTCSVGG